MPPNEETMIEVADELLIAFTEGVYTQAGRVLCPTPSGEGFRSACVEGLGDHPKVEGKHIH
jgi:hypothetical protein